MKRQALIETANEKVPIIEVCRMIGMDVDDGWVFRSRKLHCPFGDFYHSDGGIEPAFRLYLETNHAFCFAGCGRFTPVWLLAQARDISSKQAAVELLDRVGHKPASLAQAWAQVTEPSSVRPDATMLAEALKTYCQRVCPAWGDAQFDPVVAAMLTRCLALLDVVGTDGDAVRWLDGCKSAMYQVLQPHSTVHSP